MPSGRPFSFRWLRAYSSLTAPAASCAASPTLLAASPTCEAALAKGGADFYVVGQLGEPGGVACELQITRSGARLRCTQGALGLLALTGHGDGVRRLPFRTSGGVTLGDGAASVVLPTALLQARLIGADGATAVVQAGSPFVRDLIVSTARKFAM